MWVLFVFLFCLGKFWRKKKEENRRLVKNEIPLLRFEPSFGRTSPSVPECDTYPFKSQFPTMSKTPSSKATLFPSFNRYSISGFTCCWFDSTPVTTTTFSIYSTCTCPIFLCWANKDYFPQVKILDNLRLPSLRHLSVHYWRAHWARCFLNLSLEEIEFFFYTKFLKQDIKKQKKGMKQRSLY